LIKYGPQKKKTDAQKMKDKKQLPKRTLSESGRKLWPQKSREMDKNNSSEYSHHQYRPISVEFFNRSLNSPESVLRRYNATESKSDHAIRVYSKQAINDDADQLDNLAGDDHMCGDQKNDETDAVENLVNQSVTDIQMGSAEADKKYGG
jgi:hypothetical protein